MTMNGMFDEKKPPVTLDSMITCVKREIAMRKSVYPKWVGAGRMKQHSADNEIRLMEGVLGLLQRMQAACAEADTLTRSDQAETNRIVVERFVCG